MAWLIIFENKEGSGEPGEVINSPFKGLRKYCLMNASRFSYNRVNQVGKIKEITLCLLFSCLLKSYHGFVNKINFTLTAKISLFLIVLRNFLMHDFRGLQIAWLPYSLLNPTREQKLTSGRLLTNMTAYTFLPNTINEHYYSISVINFLTFTMSSSLEILISCVLPKSIRLNRSAIAMTGNYLQITREKLLRSIILKNESIL